MKSLKIDPSFVLWIGPTMPFLKASSFDKGLLKYRKSRAHAKILKIKLPYFETHKIILVRELRSVAPFHVINNTVQPRVRVLVSTSFLRPLCEGGLQKSDCM